jgi:ribonuclease HI
MSLLRRSSSLIYQIFCDGASRSNPGDASIGVSISLDGKEIHTISRKIGIATNNEAEYQALIDALNYCIDNSIKEIEVFLDSNLVVEQVNKNFKVKAGNLKALNSQVENMIKEFEYIEFKHVYREENKRADQLANMALDS